jgi:protein-S-isoprenylcysteine O-methyltransferase Ste14
MGSEGLALDTRHCHEINKLLTSIISRQGLTPNVLPSSYYVFYLVSKVNTYAAANVRVEEGQKVISTGVYGFIRHPMYFGALFLLVGSPLALGSWWSLLLVPLFVPILYFRIVNEEKVLARDLQGYAAYMRKVRYRLVPYLW